MPKLRVNGVDLNFIIEGPEEAEVLTFVHGQGFDLKSWTRQTVEFKKKYRVLCIDLRGHGGTEIGSLKKPGWNVYRPAPILSENSIQFFI